NSSRIKHECFGQYAFHSCLYLTTSLSDIDILQWLHRGTVCHSLPIVQERLPSPARTRTFCDFFVCLGAWLTFNAARNRKTACICSWQTRDSDTFISLLISFMVSSS